MLRASGGNPMGGDARPAGADPIVPPRRSRRFERRRRDAIVARMFSTLALLSLASLSSLSPAVSDEHDLVVRKDGKQVECRVLLETDAKVVYRAKGKTVEVPRAEVSEVQSLERGLREYLARFEKIDPHDVAALTDLAQFAEAHALPGEARSTWLRVLSVDPVNEKAWTQLGGLKRRDGWELKVRGRFYSLDELRTRVADWKNALELPTAHFLLRTDGKPERALDAAIDLERAWCTFYDVIGKPLDLYAFDELPEVNVYADPKDYPAPPTQGMAAWFDRSANTLNVNLTQSSDSGTIVAELVDTLVFNSFRRTLGRAGEIEPWARKGLSYAFAAAVRPSPGRVSFEFQTPYTPHFAAQARDEKPLTLEKVLRAGFASFDSGSDGARYVAQSYTLVHFLAFYEQGKYRAGFADFLRRSYLGKGGTSNFYEALGADEKTLQEQWTGYVKSVAGA